MRRLSVASQQLVEIAKALSHRNAGILIFDEPTSAIGEKDTARLFAAMRELAAAGKGIIFVTHRLGEIFEIASRYTVLRDGSPVASGVVAEIGPEALIEMMVGTPVHREFVERPAPSNIRLLEVKDLALAPQFQAIGFTLHEGEILGIYGRIGSGRTEVLDAIYGLRRPDTGSVCINGRRLEPGKPAAALQAGIAYVTEDRKRNGLVLCASTGPNLSMSVIERFRKWGLLDRARENRSVEEAIRRWHIRPPDPRQIGATPEWGQPAESRSRPLYSQQSESAAARRADARRRCRGQTRDLSLSLGLSQSGGGAIMVSSDLEEILGVSDRILVMRNGRLATSFTREEATQKKLLMAAA